MNKFAQLLYGMLIVITFVIQMYDYTRFYAENDVIVPIFGYKYQWWMALFCIDW